MTVLIALHTRDKIILGAYTESLTRAIRTINDITYSSYGSESEAVHFESFCQTNKPEHSDQIGIQRFFNNFYKWLDEGHTVLRTKTNYFIVFEERLFHYCDGATVEILAGDFRIDGAGLTFSWLTVNSLKSVQEAHLHAPGAHEMVELTKSQAYN